MLIRCAWCHTTTGNRPPYGGKHDAEIKNGICDDCLTHYFPHEAEKVQKLKEAEEAARAAYNKATEAAKTALNEVRKPANH